MQRNSKKDTRGSAMQCSMNIEITFVLTNIYNNWPRIRQVRKKVLFGGAACARTGSERLAGLVQMFMDPAVKDELVDTDAHFFPCIPLS